MADKSVSTEVEDGKNPLNALVSILHNIQLNFPFFKQEPKQQQQSSTPNPEPPAQTLTPSKPDTVRVPESRKEYPSLVLETEEGQEQPTGSSTMWQVYALGGFMIGRWLWARYCERQRKRKEESDKRDSTQDDVSPSPDI